MPKKLGDEWLLDLRNTMRVVNSSRFRARPLISDAL